MATFQDFINQNPPCSSLQNSIDARIVFDIISKKKNIIAMVTHSTPSQGSTSTPALTAVVNEIEAHILSTTYNDFSLDKPFNRTAVGRMIKTILEPFGYTPDLSRRLPKSVRSKFFTSATCYQFTGNALLQVFTISSIVKAYSTSLSSQHQPSKTSTSNNPSSIDVCNDYFDKIGFNNYFIKVIGDGCCLELTERDTLLLISKRAEIYSFLSNYFSSITLDLKPRTDN